MTAARDAATAGAEIARQARELLGRIRDSRWPGFAPAPGPPGPPRPCAPPAGASVAGAAPEVPRGRCDQRPAAASADTSGAAPAPWRSLNEIAAAVSGCAKCPLGASRTRPVPGEGDPRARLMFVGEAPGADEDAQGRPFVGAAGKLLDRMIAAMGLARSEVFIANILKCRPPGNRDPQPEEVEACLPYLRAQIALVGPEVICALGRHPAHALLGCKDPLGRLRGRFFDAGGTPLLPTYHPSYLLRTPGDKAAAWKDLQLVMQRLGLPLPSHRQPGEEEGR